MNAVQETGTIGWGGIARLGLVQVSLGALVVLMTATMNRVMVIEWGLPALVPGALVALHYGIQVLRPRLGYGSDMGGRRTPWIVGGVAVLAVGSVAAAAATALMGVYFWPALVLAATAYALVGIGVGAAGTSVLVLLASRVAPSRRAAAATIVWLMMLAGIAATSGIAGQMLRPFSPLRLVEVTAVAAAIAMALTVFAVWRAEPATPAAPAASHEPQRGFLASLREVWAEPRARRFALFVFASMLAYSAQELILEPFAGAVFHLAPGATAGLTGMQHGGVLLGMLAAAIAGRFVSLRLLTIGGCAGSAAILLCLAVAGFVGPAWPLLPTVFALGVANGAFAASAIGAMMGLAATGRARREGTRMGLWGAAQAVAFGLGGLIGTGASDLARALLGAPDAAYAAVFVFEAALFGVAAWQAARVFEFAVNRSPHPAPAQAGGPMLLPAGE